MRLKHIKLFEDYSEEVYDRILDIYNEVGLEGMTPEEIEYLRNGGETRVPDERVIRRGRERVNMEEVRRSVPYKKILELGFKENAEQEKRYFFDRIGVLSFTHPKFLKDENLKIGSKGITLAKDNKSRMISLPGLSLTDTKTTAGMIKALDALCGLYLNRSGI